MAKEIRSIAPCKCDSSFSDAQTEFALPLLLLLFFFRTPYNALRILLCFSCTARAFVRVVRILKIKAKNGKSEWNNYACQNNAVERASAKTSGWGGARQNESDKRRRDRERKQRPSESPWEKRGKRKAGEGGGRGPFCLIVTPDQCVKWHPFRLLVNSIRAGARGTITVQCGYTVCSRLPGGRQADNKGVRQCLCMCEPSVGR